MTRRFISQVAAPAERGREFGEVHAGEVARTVSGYRRLFAAYDEDVDLPAMGAAALARVDEWAPDLGEEIRGIAAGSGLPVTDIAAINARTEILAILRQSTWECSTVVALRGSDEEPVAMQNWDWYLAMADNWLQWTIPHPDGRRIETVTEYGIVGKIGANDRGLGVLFNMLHHRADGDTIGVPVHVIARRVLDAADNVDAARAICASAAVSASTAVTVVGGRSAGHTAVSVELWPGGPGYAEPEPDGLLVRTNHFLSDAARAGDLVPDHYPDTTVRLEALRRELQGRGGGLTADEALKALSGHDGLLCCHPDPVDPPELRHATLATVGLDLGAGRLVTRVGPPCGDLERLRSTAS
jgi:isopenicillin-N N-acyltransferase like protein